MRYSIILLASLIGFSICQAVTWPKFAWDDKLSTNCFEKDNSSKPYAYKFKKWPEGYYCPFNQTKNTATCLKI